MNGRLGSDVMKRKAMFGFKDGLIGNFAAQNLGKNVIGIVCVSHDKPQSLNIHVLDAIDCALSVLIFAKLAKASPLRVTLLPWTRRK